MMSPGGALDGAAGDPAVRGRGSDLAKLTDAALELRLFAKTGNGNRQGHRRIAEPD